LGRMVNEKVCVPPYNTVMDIMSTVRDPITFVLKAAIKWSAIQSDYDSNRRSYIVDDSTEQ